MARLVMKFGGTSVADIPRIRNVARHVKREVDAGHEVAVVVSAMAGHHQPAGRLDARDRRSLHDAREYDTVVAAGEQVTSGLLAPSRCRRSASTRAPGRAGRSRSAPTARTARRASSRSTATRLIERLGQGQVAVVAGFQGIAPGQPHRHARPRRLRHQRRGDRRGARGRPLRHLHRRRRRLHHRPAHRAEGAAAVKISYEEMLEMASLGAKVLQVRSVELAMVHGVRTFVRSSFDDPDAPELASAGDPPGTLICDEEEIVEKKIVTGIAYSKDEAQISLRRVADKPGVAAAVFGPLAEANINVDMIVQNVSEDGTLTDLTFTVPTADYERSRKVLERRARRDRLSGHPGLDRRRQDLGDRHRHAQPCRRRGRVLPGARRPGHQHPGDHDVRDQDIGVDRRALHRACGTDFAFAIRARQRTDRRVRARRHGRRATQAATQGRNVPRIADHAGAITRRAARPAPPPARDHGGADQRASPARQDRDADRGQHGGRGVLGLCAALRRRAGALRHRGSEARGGPPRLAARRPGPGRHDRRAGAAAQPARRAEPPGLPLPAGDGRGDLQRLPRRADAARRPHARRPGRPEQVAPHLPRGRGRGAADDRDGARRDDRGRRARRPRPPGHRARPQAPDDAHRRSASAKASASAMSSCTSRASSSPR